MAELDADAFNTIFHEAEVNRVVLEVPTAVQVTITPLRGGQNSGRPIRVELSPIGRVLASLRAGRWDDRRAKTLPLSMDELAELVGPYEETVYGDLFNQSIETHAHWTNRVSVDWQDENGYSDMNRLDLFKNPAEGHLDVLIWFGEARIIDEAGDDLAPDDVAAEVKAWWAAIQSGAMQDGDHGIYMLAPGQFRPWWKRFFRR